MDVGGKVLGYHASDSDILFDNKKYSDLNHSKSGSYDDRGKSRAKSGSSLLASFSHHVLEHVRSSGITISNEILPHPNWHSATNSLNLTGDVMICRPDQPISPQVDDAVVSSHSHILMDSKSAELLPPPKALVGGGQELAMENKSESNVGSTPSGGSSYKIAMLPLKKAKSVMGTGG